MHKTRVALLSITILMAGTASAMPQKTHGTRKWANHPTKPAAATSYAAVYKDRTGNLNRVPAQQGRSSKKAAGLNSTRLATGRNSAWNRHGK